jgi:hypothetical protein
MHGVSLDCVRDCLLLFALVYVLQSSSYLIDSEILLVLDWHVH